MVKKFFIKIAVSVLLAAALPLSAATLYEEDDVRLDLDINYTVRLLMPESRDIDSRGAYDLDHKNLDIGVGVSQELGEYFGLDLKGLGVLNTDWSDGDIDGDNYEAYVGLDIGHAVIYAGSLYWGSSELAVQSPYNHGLDYDVNLAGRRRRIPRGLGAYELNTTDEFDSTALVAERGDSSVRVDIPTEYMTAVVSTDFDNDVIDLFMHSSTDAFEQIPADFDGIGFGLLYQYIRPSDAGKGDYMHTYGVRASYEMQELAHVGRMMVAVDYSFNDAKSALQGQDMYGTTIYRGQAANLALIAPLTIVEDTLVGVGYGYTAPKHTVDNFSRWYVNATHNFTDNVSIFGEIGGNDEGDEDIVGGGTGFLAGMNINF